jgi:hypothetical protein
MSGVTAEDEALRAELERAILEHLRGSVELMPEVELRNWERIESPSGPLGEVFAGELFLSALRRDLLPEGNELQIAASRVREGFNWGRIETDFRHVAVSGDHLFSEGSERLTLGLYVQATR